MSKKKLLNESTVRQFMKYANLGGLAENFVSETYGAVEEDEVEEGLAGQLAGGALGSVAGPLGSMAGAAVGDKLTGEDEEGIEPMDDDMPVDDLGDEELADEPAGEELPPEAISALERAVEAAADAMLDALAPFGVEGEASVEGDEAPIDDMGDEAPMDDMDDMDAAPEFPGDEGPEDEEILDEVDMIDEDEIVQETMKRVMKRLSVMKENKTVQDEKDKTINSVADAIVARLRAKK